MAIGPIHLEWISSLASRGYLRGALLELGPQDIQISRDYLATVAKRHDRLLNFDLSPVCQPDFYKLFGIAKYRSLDENDRRADFKADLNKIVRLFRRYDVITNFGTAEHVFNIAATFATIHRALKPGGIALHAMPCFAFINHGYYNVHPNLFIDLAKANAYEIIDLFYIDNIYARGKTQVADVSLNFKTLPIQIETTQNFVSSVVHRFAENIATSHPSLTDGHACFVFDLCFAALRKTRQSPRRIRIPLQEF